jgi:hypothetical protein
MTLRRELLTALGCVLAAGGLAYAAPATTSGDEECPDEPKCPAPVAQAQPQPAHEPAYHEPAYEPAPAPAPAPAATPVAYEPAPSVTVEQQPSYSVPGGFSVTLGGGVDAFSRSGMRNITSTGGSWNLRATIGTKEYAALEGSYIGSAQSFNQGFNQSATLVGNGAQIALRLNATRNVMAQPFIYGGAAWRHYSITNRSTNFDLLGANSRDNVAEFPLGIGVSGHFGGFTADVRGEYRFVVDQNLVPDVNSPGNSLNMDRWGVMGNIGYEL